MVTMTPLRQRMIEDMTLRNLSRQTLQSHVYAVALATAYAVGLRVSEVCRLKPSLTAFGFVVAKHSGI